MRTPYYILNLDTMKKNYIEVSNQLSSCSIRYSTKANSDFTMLKSLSTYVEGFEISSIKEFDFFRTINYDPNKLFYGIPIKDEVDIAKLYELGCRYFVFASENELLKLQKHAPQARKILRMKVTDFSESSIPYGIDLNTITQTMAQQTDGFLFHISNTNIDEHIEALDRLEKIIEKYVMRRIILNIGGSYYSKKSDSFYPELNCRLQVLKKKYQLNLVAEMGSAIVNTAGLLNTKVLHMEHHENLMDVYIDAGYPSGVLCTPEQIINLSTNRENDAFAIYRFIDTSCLRKVLFIKRLPLKIQVGDILQFQNYGAYSLCYINKFHNQYEPHIEYISNVGGD